MFPGSFWTRIAYIRDHKLIAVRSDEYPGAVIPRGRHKSPSNRICWKSTADHGLACLCRKVNKVFKVGKSKFRQDTDLTREPVGVQDHRKCYSHRIPPPNRSEVRFKRLNRSSIHYWRGERLLAENSALFRWIAKIERKNPSLLGSTTTSAGLHQPRRHLSYEERSFNSFLPYHL